MTEWGIWLPASLVAAAVVGGAVQWLFRHSRRRGLARARRRWGVSAAPPRAQLEEQWPFLGVAPFDSAAVGSGVVGEYAGRNFLVTELSWHDRAPLLLGAVAAPSELEVGHLVLPGFSGAELAAFAPEVSDWCLCAVRGPANAGRLETVLRQLTESRWREGVRG